MWHSRYKPKLTISKYGVHLAKSARCLLNGPVAFEEIDGEWFVYNDPEGFRYNLNGYVSSRALAHLMIEKFSLSGKVTFDLQRVGQNRYKLKLPQQ